MGAAADGSKQPHVATNVPEQPHAADVEQSTDVADHAQPADAAGDDANAADNGWCDWCRRATGAGHYCSWWGSTSSNSQSDVESRHDAANDAGHARRYGQRSQWRLWISGPGRHAATRRTLCDAGPAARRRGFPRQALEPSGFSTIEW